MVGTRVAVVAVAVAVALLQCGGLWCACAEGRPRVMRRAIVEMMARDWLYADVLAERVKLGDDVPAAYRERLLPPGADADRGVDPLAALLELMAPRAYQSGRDVTVAATVLGAAVRCHVYKRVAVNAQLLANSCELNYARKELVVHVDMMGQLVLLAADMLGALGAPHDELIALLQPAKEYRIVEQFNRAKLTAEFKAGAAVINNAVNDGCVPTDLTGYMTQLCKSNPAVEKIANPDAAAGPAGQKELWAATYLLDESENAILDDYERMHMLRTMDEAVWKKLFDYADMPAGNRWTNKEVRHLETPLRDQVVQVMDRTAKTAALKLRQAEREAVANGTPATPAVTAKNPKADS